MDKWKKMVSGVPALSLGILTVACIGCKTTPGKASTGGPAVYKVVFENERVRAIEYHTGSEKSICGFGMHTHPAHLYIMLTDAKLRVITPDGKEKIENAKAGEVGWEPAGQHTAENLMGNNAGCYLIEIKDKEWKPSTGLTQKQTLLDRQLILREFKAAGYSLPETVVDEVVRKHIARE
jgi:hypothetical protein